MSPNRSSLKHTEYFGHTELPEKQQQTLRRAIRIDRIDLVVRTFIVALMISVAGSSQAMKAAWIEDALSFLPPLAFLLAVRVIRRAPTPPHPYGYHRSMGVAHLVASTALLTMGVYLVVDSGMGLATAEHPPIGMMELFGMPVWAGWPMIIASIITAIPCVILGRIKAKLAPVLHNKVLAADADMNRADWLTAITTVIGILGIGIGLWWADSAAAILISITIINDGVQNLRACIADLMDARATTYDSKQPHPLVEEVRHTLRELDWASDADCRVRDQGNVFHIEAFVVPREGTTLTLEQLATAREKCIDLDWKVQDLVVVPVAELPKEFLPQVAEKRADQKG